MDLYTNEDSQELLQSLDRALPYNRICIEE